MQNSSFPLNSHPRPSMFCKSLPVQTSPEASVQKTPPGEAPKTFRGQGPDYYNEAAAEPARGRRDGAASETCGSP